MKKTLLLAGVACLFASQAMAFNPYIGAKFKYSVQDAKFTTDTSDDLDIDDKVVGGSIAIGTEHKVIGGALRLEAEFNQNADAEKNHPDMFYIDNETGEISGPGTIKLKLKTKSIMFNAYFDIDTGTGFKPYVGGGFGAGWNNLEVSGDLIYGEKKYRRLAWQIGTGVGYDVNSNVTLDVGYRYIDYGDKSYYDSFLKENVKIETTAHEFYAGFRYNF